MNRSEKPKAMSMAAIVGNFILVNVDPPTLARTIEVADALASDMSLEQSRKIMFLQGITRGAVEALASLEAVNNESTSLNGASQAAV